MKRFAVRAVLGAALLLATAAGAAEPQSTVEVVTPESVAARRGRGSAGRL